MNVIIMEPSITFDFLKAIKVHDGIFSFPRNENLGDNNDDSSKYFWQYLNTYNNITRALIMHTSIALLTWDIR